MTHRTWHRTCAPALLLSCGATVLLSACAAGSPPDDSAGPAPDRRPSNLVLMIADGMGPASVTLARSARQLQGLELTLDRVLLGSVATRPSLGLVTDSAAAATALATGQRTLNGAISVDGDGQRLATLLEAAEVRGMATGLVSTTTLAHATPACFAAHDPSRASYDELAEQMLQAGCELLLAGGRRDFVPMAAGGRRKDDLNLLQRATNQGYQVLASADELRASQGLPLLGLFSWGQMAYEADRDPALEPSLTEMASVALERLSADGAPFLLVIEGGRIDHAAHDNDGVGHLHDTLAFDDALAAVLAFVESRHDTLLVVTADHETGGLGLGCDRDGVATYAYHPERLLAARASAELLADQLMLDAEPRALLASSWSVDDLTDDELARLQAGKQTERLEALAQLMSQRAGLGWTTHGHTGVDVMLGAAGPGAASLAGHHDNDELGRRMALLMGFDLAALTAAQRASAGRR